MDRSDLWVDGLRFKAVETALLWQPEKEHALSFNSDIAWLEGAKGMNGFMQIGGQPLGRPSTPAVNIV